MEWSQQDAFRLKIDNLKSWMFEDGTVVGQFASQGPLTFLAIDSAGHMVPMDQPRVGLEMFKRFIKGEQLSSDSVLL
jgi:carboxypeptidase C (cathepsin A)